MSSKLQVALFIITVIVIIIIIQLGNSSSNKEKEDYLKSLQFEFSGIVTGKKEVYSATGLVYVDLIHSTISEYTQRSKNGYYYCIVKDNKAEIIETMNVAEVGDSIVVDGFKGMVTVYREGKKVTKKKIWVSDFDLFYKDVKKLHRLHKK